MGRLPPAQPILESHGWWLLSWRGRQATGLRKGGSARLCTDLGLPTGNVVNGMIARQMVDMLVESSSNVEMILKFFDMFLKLKDIVGSEAFQDYVTDPRGLISKKDFQKVGAGR